MLFKAVLTLHIIEYRLAILACRSNRGVGQGAELQSKIERQELGDGHFHTASLNKPHVSA